MGAEQQRPVLENYRPLGPTRIGLEPLDSTIVVDDIRPGVSGPGWGRDVSPGGYQSLSDQDKLELRFVRKTILQVFTDRDTHMHPKSLGDIFPMYKDNDTAKQKATERFARFITSSYFPEGELSLKEAQAMVQTAVTKANDYINHFENGMLRDFNSSIGM